MSLQPIKIWGHWGGPNPWKVIILLEELALPYELRLVEFSDVKKPEYLEVTPQRTLTYHQGSKYWNPSLGGNDSSAAIILYLIEQYDKEGKLSYNQLPERYLTQQWLAFQASGQGPYYGQATWFARFHPEKLPSATERYVNEVIRVIGVLEEGLARNGTGWLVGDKCTYADLSFITWNGVGEGLLQELNKADKLEEDYPRYTAWMKSLKGREKVARCMALIAEARVAHGLR
ncbi:glutathione S-transferase [Penicillium atrosanguineum]|nr:glutathione S-transferase [Penicillium atrosanguineum]